MSVQWTSYVFAASPYNASHLTVHLAMADYAKDDGTLWPSQEKLAEKARVSVRQLIRILNKMVEDGFLLVSRKGRRNLYRLLRPQDGHGLEQDFLEPEQVTPMSPIEEPIGDTCVTCIEPSRSLEPPNPLPPPAGSGVERPSRSNALEVSMAVIGEFGDPPEPEHRTERAARRKRRGDGRTTFNDCVAEFARQSRQIGHREFNIGIVRKAISTLHKEHGLEYERIKELIETFFARFEQKARSADNIAAVFRHYTPQLLRTEDRAQDAYGETQEDWEALWEREQEKKRRIRDQLLGRSN